MSNGSSTSAGSGPGGGGAGGGGDISFLDAELVFDAVVAPAPVSTAFLALGVIKSSKGFGMLAIGGGAVIALGAAAPHNGRFGSASSSSSTDIFGGAWT